MHQRFSVFALATLWLCCILTAFAAAPQGTAFTYQGELRQNGSPVTGSVDATFALFDAAVGGSQVGSTLVFAAGGANALAVDGGVFTVSLDFGPLAFNALVSDQRYLAVAIEGNALSPRTKIENAPYALQSRTAELAYTVANGSVGAAQIVPAQVQQRVSATCAGASSIQSIGQNGSVTCHADSGTITGVTAGTGLSGGGTSGNVGVAIANPLQLDGTDVNGVIAAHNTAAAGPVRAIVGTSDATSGSAIKGVSAALTGTTYALAGNAASPNAIAIIGQNTASSGYATGVIGISPSPTGNAVVGWATASTGEAWGTVGSTNSPDGTGAYGVNYATSGAAHGIRGISDSTDGIGVYGEAAAASGSSTGVKGTSVSSDGTGVAGAGGYAGVYGYSGSGTGVNGQSSADAGTGVSGYATATTGANVGVFGITYSSAGGHGVEGTATNASGANAGVYGSAYSSTGVGVYGAGNNGSAGIAAWSGDTGYGLSAYSFGSNGIYAESGSANVGIAALRAYNVKGYGVAGEGGNVGVYAHNLTGTPGRDVYLSTSALAGDFYGNVFVHGSLTKSSGTFKIDHPLDPANKYLSHSFVESPDMKNVYDGVATLDAHGQTWVELPAYFEALNRDFRYQLTALDRPGPSLFVADRISANRFRIAGGTPNQEVSWQVTGTRKDAWAQAHRVVVEEDKTPAERGHYIAPEVFGYAQDAALAPPLTEEAQPAPVILPEVPRDVARERVPEAPRPSRPLMRKPPPEIGARP